MHVRDRGRVEPAASRTYRAGRRLNTGRWRPPVGALLRRAARNALYLLSGGVLGAVEVVTVLQVQPKLGRDAEVLPEPERRIAGDPPAAAHDFADAVRQHAQHAQHAAELGRAEVEPGEVIRVATRRGVIEIKARRDGKVPKGVIFIPFCYVDAAANLLTNAARDPVGKTPEYKFCAARIEKSPAMAAD